MTPRSRATSGTSSQALSSTRNRAKWKSPGGKMRFPVLESLAFRLKVEGRGHLCPSCQAERRPCEPASRPTSRSCKIWSSRTWRTWRSTARTRGSSRTSCIARPKGKPFSLILCIHVYYHQKKPCCCFLFFYSYSYGPQDILSLLSYSLMRCPYPNWNAQAHKYLRRHPFDSC